MRALRLLERQMGTIINLYVIPRKQNSNNLHGAQVAEIIVNEHLVAPPVVIGPAFTDHERLVEPQLAELLMQSQFDDPYVGANYTLLPRRYVEMPETFADFGRTNEPQIAAFSRLDATNPAIRNDFSHYTGWECSVGIYIVPRGFRLLLVSEFCRDPLFDGTIFEWIHLQGKSAPWLDIYHWSCIDRAVRTVWHEVDVVERDAL
jgi:hypothetical protein